MENFEDRENFEDKEIEEDFNNEDSKIQDLLTPLKEVEETIDDDFENPIEEEIETDPEIEKEEKKRVKRFSKLGAKGIVKGLDLGNANLCRKLSYSDSALEYRADPEALEDLTEIVEEILPKKKGKDLNIPIWLQLIIFILIAFLPTIFTALSDRTDNKENKKLKEEMKKIKREKKRIKKEMQKLKLEKELKLELEKVNEEPTEEEKMKILTRASEE